MDDREFERHLREALHREADRLPFRIDAMTVHERLASRPWLPTWLIPVLLPVGAAVVVGVVLLKAFPGPIDEPSTGSATDGAPVAMSPTESAAPTVQATPAATPHPAFGRRRATAYRDGMFYVIGGLSGAAQESRAVVLFDGLAWSDLPSLPEGRAGAGAAVLSDGRLAVFGGEIDGQPTDSTLVFEPGAGDWAPGTPMPYPQADMAVTVLRESAYLVGGSASDREPAVLAFDFASDEWTVQPMPVPLDNVTATTYGDAIYVVGDPAAGNGQSGGASMFRFDPAAARWTPLSPPPVRPVATAAAGGRIWAIGIADVNHHGVAFYEPETDAWTLTDEQLPPGRATMVIPSDRTILVIGAGTVGMTMTVIDLETP